MSFVIVFVLWLLTRILGAPLQVQEERLRRLKESLLEVEEAARAGAIDLRRMGSAGRSDLALVLSVADESRRAGRPMLASIRALRRQVVVSARMLAEGRRLWQLITGRMTCGILLAAIGRAYLLYAVPAERIEALHREDWAAVAVAIIVALVAQECLRRMLPLPWLFRKGLTVEGRHWLMLHAGGGLGHASEKLLPLAAVLGASARREALNGVSLAEERRRQIRDWGFAESRSDRQKLRKLEDWLPMLELCGIGLPAGLLLLVPALSIRL